MKISEITVDYVNHMGNDLSVVNAARVSFHKESKEMSLGDEKLINYLAKHKHFSPFNHTFLTFKIKAPIFVSRQLVKHKFMPWNEVSRRYVDEEPEFYIPQLRKRAENVKQGSSDELMNNNWRISGEVHTENMLSYYTAAIKAGMAPEVARAFLPQSMMTEWYWSGTLGAYADMLRLRLDPHTQAESRVVANLIHEEIKKLFPISIKALLND
jgi:thymidylate synthase (FAD)